MVWDFAISTFEWKDPLTKEATAHLGPYIEHFKIFSPDENILLKKIWHYLRDNTIFRNMQSESYTQECFDEDHIPTRFYFPDTFQAIILMMNENGILSNSLVFKHDGENLIDMHDIVAT